MRLWPDSLLWRAVLLIVLLILASQLAWLSIFRYQERGPRGRQLAQQIVSVVNLTRTALITSQPSRRRLLLRELSKSEGIQVYPADAAPELTALPPRPVLNIITRQIRQQLGEKTRVLTTLGKFDSVWISFSMGDESFDQYWVAIPRARLERTLTGQWIGWGLLALGLSIVGAFLIVSHINRPLKALTEAARQLGQGANPPSLEETGPEEIRTLSHTFNQMTRDLSRLDQERSLLLAGVSHDLRTPLARLRLSVEMLGENTDISLRDGMIQDIEDMDTIITQFIAFMHEGNQEMSVEGDLNKLVQEVCERYKRHDRTIRFQLGALPMFKFKPMAMQRLLTNLVDNALRYGGAEVEVRTTLENTTIVLSVLDRGPGIPESEMARLIQPFTRLDASRGGKGGSGLGLAIVDRIAKLHKGSFTLLPREGGGLEAKLTIPV